MLRSAKEIEGYTLNATDDTLGRVLDFYFDDRDYSIRNLAVDTGRWLPGRKVLISPLSLGEPDWGRETIPVSLTREQVEKSPSLREDQPVSKQHMAELAAYYGWGPYVIPPVTDTLPEAGKDEDGDPHLRSRKEVGGYHVAAVDGEIGHVEDMILEADDWVFRYYVVDTRNWLPGRNVLVPAPWVTGIDWERECIATDLERERVRNCPPYDPAQPVNREYEVKLYDYYGRPVPWA